MERFLHRHQALKPDPGIVARTQKAKAHRRVEKLIDATLHKRKKLETRSQAVAQGVGDIAASRPGDVFEWHTKDIHGSSAGHTIIRETMPGQTGSALHHAFVPARSASAPGVVPKITERKNTQPEGTTFHVVIPAKGNNAKYRLVQAGQQTKDAEAQRTLVNSAHVHPGLMWYRMLGIK